MADEHADAPVKQKDAELEETILPEPTAAERLVAKIVNASTQIKPIGKDGRNDFSHYSFQSEAAIKAAVKPALESVGLVVTFKYELLHEFDVGKNHCVVVSGLFTVTDGEASQEFQMVAGGSDTVEKAYVKATTTAQKYFYKQLFNISDNDTDPDAESGTSTNDKVQKLPRINGKLVVELKQLILAQYKTMPEVSSSGKPKPRTTIELTDMWLGVVNKKSPDHPAKSIEKLTPAAGQWLKGEIQKQLQQLSGGGHE